MKAHFIFFFIVSISISYAQQSYTQDIFEPNKPVTKTYATNNGEDLELDIYTPKADTNNLRPLIIFMHGGGFSGGSKTSEGEIAFANAAAKKGYVAVQIGYRLTRKNKSFGCDYSAFGKMETFQLAAEDFMDAVNYMIINKDDYKIDPKRIIVGGSSAGAEAVLNAVYNQNLMFEDVSKFEHIKFSGVFSLAGAIVDARYITKENSVPGVFFHGTKDNLVPFATGPHHWCDKNLPGYIILDGSKTIIERLKELDSSYLLYSFEGGMHEHSGMPKTYFNEIFDFFNEVFLERNKLQIINLK